MEEDIKILEEFIEYSQEMINDMEYERPVDVTISQNEIQAIKNLINRNRELEALKNSCPAIPTTGIECDLKKELEEDYTSVYLKGVYDERDKWKSKIKEKIEELNKKLNNGGKTYGRYGGCVINSENIMKLQNQIQVLEELLQEGENNER